MRARQSRAALGLVDRGRGRDYPRAIWIVPYPETFTRDGSRMGTTQQAWGPRCQLVEELQKLRDLSTGRRGPAGLMKIEEELSRQLRENKRSGPFEGATLETFNKATVKKILEGDGRKPSWSQVWSLVTALRALAVVADEAISDHALKELWELTAPQIPDPVSVHHDAVRTFVWGRERYEAIRGRSSGRTSPLVEGVVAVGPQASRSKSVRYDAVYDVDTQNDLTQLMEQPYLRHGSFKTHTEFGDVGFRVWGPIRTGARDITSFTGLDVNDRGVASVYFRWCLASFPTDNRWRVDSPLHWGLMGAKDLVLDAHRYLGSRGDVRAAVFSPNITRTWSMDPSRRHRVHSDTDRLGGLDVSPRFKLGLGADWDESWSTAAASLERFLLTALESHT